MQPEQPPVPNQSPEPPVTQPPQQAPPVPVAAQPEVPEQPQPVAYAQPPEQTAVLQQDAVEPQPEQAIQWQAPEYIDHARSPMWFVGFWVVAIILMIIAAFVIRSWSFAILVPAMAAALMIYSHRPPRQLSYVLSQKGIYINDQLHPMEEFRSFGVLQDESIPALMLIPVKRFRPGLTVHFPVEYGEQIVDLLGSRIPMKDLHLDAFDKIVRKLRM